jgi:uncharacterized membrane protein YphA (DoxX/SURF4 family)
VRPHTLASGPRSDGDGHEIESEEPVLNQFFINLLVLLGLGTRLAAVPLITIMCVALGSTKWPILMDRGFWAAAHESRTDWSMLLGSLFLLLEGAGPWSMDAKLSRTARGAEPTRRQ